MNLYLCLFCYLAFVSSSILVLFFLLTCSGKRGGMNMVMIVPILIRRIGSLGGLKSWKLIEDRSLDWEGREAKDGREEKEEVSQQTPDWEGREGRDGKEEKKLLNRLLRLRALDPNYSSNIDKYSVLGDTIVYAKGLQRQVKELQEELEGNSIDERAKEISNVCRKYGNLQSEILSQIETIIANKPENEKMEKNDSEIVETDHVRDSLLDITQNLSAEFTKRVA